MKKKLLLALGLMLLPVVSNAATPVDCRLMKRNETALACTIYYEARGATYLDKLAVSFITINRSKKVNKSIVKIVKEPGQFTYLRQKKLVPREKEAWEESKSLAKQMIRLAQDDTMYSALDFTRGATYYHDTSIKNPWNFTKTFKTANLVTYRDDKL